jgi:hypothetical protein
MLERAVKVDCYVFGGANACCPPCLWQRQHRHCHLVVVIVIIVVYLSPALSLLALDIMVWKVGEVAGRKDVEMSARSGREDDDAKMLIFFMTNMFRRI